MSTLPNDKIAWNIDDPDLMSVSIMRDGKTVMNISVYEIIESCSRIKVMQHVLECDNTPWLTRWQNEKHQALLDMLEQDYT